jgi:hypothetical protein
MGTFAETAIVNYAETAIVNYRLSFAEVGVGAFSRSRARSIRRKKSAKKAKAPSAKEKSANSRFFLSPTLEARLQSPKMLGRG